MPTIKQLPAATAVAGNDLLPVSQSGLTRSVAVSTLLSTAQPVLTLAQGNLLGRVSLGLGGPEAVGIGTGLGLQGGAVTATGEDHLSLPLSTSLQLGDELVLNSSAMPKRLPAIALRSLFTAGSGVAIDTNGVISSTIVDTGTGIAVQGAKGDTGPQGPAGRGFTFRGVWQPNTAYSSYDVVVNSGQSYVASTAFTSAPTFDTTSLTLIAAQGSAGVAGPQGPTGSQGPAGAQGLAGPVVAATAAAVGAVKPGGGLTVSSDGTLSIANVPLSSLAQAGAATGQLLGWTGTGWGPTSVTAGGVSTFNARSGAISLTLADVTAVVGTGAGARASLALATVAGTGAFSDLTGAPAIPAAATTPPIVNGPASAGVASSFARADHVHPTDSSRLAVVNNLSDIANASSARANLGLGTSATLSVGTAAGTVAAGNDSRIVGAIQAGAIPAATGQLLGGSGAAGAATPIAIGTGLTLSAGTLSATGGGTAGYVLPAATTATLGGVKPDGTTITAASDGTLSATVTSGVSTFNTRSGPVSLTLGDVTAVVGTGTAARTSLGLAAVAGTGAFADLTGAPPVPAASTTAPTMNGTATAGVSGSFARADHVHPNDTSRLASASNLSDLASAATARINLGLGAAATLGVGTVSGTVAAGNDGRIVNALQPSAIPAASGLLLGGSGTIGAAGTVSIGTGLMLSGGVLSASGSGSGSYTLPAATTTALGGVKPDGSTVTAAADGTLTVTGVALTALTDISTLGGPALSDVDIVNRNNSDYRTTLSARAALYRKTPAGSRTIMLAAGSTAATLTASDHDKTVVVSGVAGTLAVDGTITDGFRCEVINHTASALVFSGITGLGAASLAVNAACWVSLSNSTVEAVLTGAGSGSYTLPAATTSTLGGVKPDGSTVTAAADGTLTVASMTTTSLTDVSTLGGPALTDVDVLNRSGTDYKTTLSGRSALFRKTPAGSRTITLASGTTTATLTASDHDKTVVVNGVAGTLAVDGTITDGFRCQIINHTGTALGFTSIAGLQGATSVPNNGSCLVTLANSSVEATPSGSATAYISAGISGSVATLPGGAGAVIYRHVFVRPCTLAVNLATPFAPQGQAGTLPSAAATFGLSKRQSSGAQTALGSITMSPIGAVSANVTSAASFAAGDQLIITAPAPADSTLADVSLTFTGTWG